VSGAAEIDVATGASAMVGLILVFLVFLVFLELIGVISSSFASYQTAEQRAALIRYQRRGWQGSPLPDSCWRFFQPYRL
jgi:hypothetical protein